MFGNSRRPDMERVEYGDPIPAEYPEVWIPLGAGTPIAAAVRSLSDRHLQIPRRTGWMRQCR
jgi:hypothetical protein